MITNDYWSSPERALSPEEEVQRQAALAPLTDDERALVEKLEQHRPELMPGVAYTERPAPSDDPGDDCQF
jgi:hypothetical protein